MRGRTIINKKFFALPGFLGASHVYTTTGWRIYFLKGVEMKIQLGLFALVFTGIAIAMPPYCNVTISAGSASGVGDPSFFPKTGAAANSSVGFSIGGLTVGVINWGGRKVSSISVPTCLNLSSQGMYNMRAFYVGLHDGSPLRSYCYSESVSRLSPKDIVVPMFPGQSWKPC